MTIFEDNRDLREGLPQILHASPGFSCLWAYANCTNLLKCLHENEPDILLMDIQMPGMSGIEAVAVLRSEFPKLPVVMQTVFEDDAKVFAAICAGEVHSHVKNIYQKLHVNSVNEVVSKALRNKLV